MEVIHDECSSALGELTNNMAEITDKELDDDSTPYSYCPSAACCAVSAPNDAIHYCSPLPSPLGRGYRNDKLCSMRKLRKIMIQGDRENRRTRLNTALNCDSTSLERPKLKPCIKTISSELRPRLSVSFVDAPRKRPFLSTLSSIIGLSSPTEVPQPLEEIFEYEHVDQRRRKDGKLRMWERRAAPENGGTVLHCEKIECSYLMYGRLVVGIADGSCAQVRGDGDSDGSTSEPESDSEGEADEPESEGSICRVTDPHPNPRSRCTPTSSRTSAAASRRCKGPATANKHSLDCSPEQTSCSRSPGGSPANACDEVQDHELQEDESAQGKDKEEHITACATAVGSITSPQQCDAEGEVEIQGEVRTCDRARNRGRKRKQTATTSPADEVSIIDGGESGDVPQECPPKKDDDDSGAGKVAVVDGPLLSQKDAGSQASGTLKQAHRHDNEASSRPKDERTLVNDGWDNGVEDMQMSINSHARTRMISEPRPKILRTQ